MTYGNSGRLLPKGGQGNGLRRGIQGERDVAQQADDGSSAKLLCVTSQLEKSNSCAIELSDFNNCKNSEYLFGVPLSGDKDGPST